MRRVIPHLLLGLLVIGLLGPISAYSWKLAVRSAEETTEESQESLEEEFTLALATLRLSVAHVPALPGHEGGARARSRRQARMAPPAQVRTPRAVSVWRPSNPVPDEEPFCR